MDAALLERGLMPLNVGRVDLTALVLRSAADASMLASARDIEVSVQDDPPQCVVLGDEMRMRQVLDNLLSNAVKYSFEGGAVCASLSAEGGRVLVRIEDAGRGIPEDGRSRVFDLFGRMDYRDDRDAAGLGLGLTISTRIAEAHGGRIYIERSDPGRGSVFVLELPSETAVGANRLPDNVSME